MSKLRQEEPVDAGLAPQVLQAINRSILDSALDCIISMDASGIVREFNPAAERVFGYTREQAVGKELAELIIPPSLREQHRRGLAHYLATGEGPVLGRRIEINACRSDGSEIMVELAISPIQIEGAPFFTAYLRDITARQRGEEAIRHLAAIIESSDDAIFSTDLQMKITTWNSGAERLFGYTGAEMIGQPITLLIPRERQDEEPKIIERIRSGQQVDHYETVRRRKDGTLLNISLTVSPIRDEKGNVIGVAKIARNISDRVQSDRRRVAQYAVASLLAGSWTLDEAAAPILEVIADIGDWICSGLWLHDKEIDLLTCRSYWHNSGDEIEKFAAHSRSVRFRRGEGLPGRVWASGKPTWISDVTVDQNFPRRHVAMEAGLRGGFAFPLFSGIGVNGVLELFSTHVVEPDPDLLRLVEALGSQLGLFIERRRIEQELQGEKEKAEAANAAKDRFLAMLSHELRTPLTPVLIWADGMAKDKTLSENMQQDLRMICRNVELEARLIDDLLDLTRVTRGKLKLQHSLADVHELLHHALEIVRNEMEDRHLDVAVALHATQHELSVDAPRLQQVFWNIVRNAYKYSPLDGSISISSRNPDANTLLLEVSDNGLGIEPQFLGKIFDAFEQVDTRREGLGLGLAISKAIVETHGGTITARSEGLGKGTTFLIELPIS
jgi:PAS domain S-box-containing protein